MGPIYYFVIGCGDICNTSYRGRYVINIECLVVNIILGIWSVSVICGIMIETCQFQTNSIFHLKDSIEEH